MISVLAELHFSGISINSVADEIDINDDDAKLGIQIRGILNELQLQELKKKTLRGLIGQKKREVSAGERIFGYKSVPFGKTVMDKKGNPRPEGYKFEIENRVHFNLLFSKYSMPITKTIQFVKLSNHKLK